MTLRRIGRLHDPGGVRVALELLHKYGVVARQHVCHGHHVHVHVVAIGVLLGDGVAFLLHVLSPSLDILNHEVLPRELKVVWKMIDQSVEKERVVRMNARSVYEYAPLK